MAVDMEAAAGLIPEKFLAKVREHGQGSPPLSGMEYERRRADRANEVPGTLTGFHCPECLDRGYFHRVDGQGRHYTQDCKCMARRRSLRYIAKSGLSEMLGRYTLGAWEARETWQRQIRDVVVRYADHPEGWLYLGGRPGTGKTHLCTALCGLLMDGGLEVRYMLWRDTARQAKALVNDDDRYQSLVRPLRSVRVLYIDDLFKTGRSRERSTGRMMAGAPTEGDINLAFDILNARYNDTRCLTLISSELTLERLAEIDEGVASRIYQRAQGQVFDLSRYEDYRLSAGKKDG